MKLGQTGKRDKQAKHQTSPLQTSRHHQDWHTTNSSLMLPWGSSSGWLANSRGNWTLTVNSAKFKSWDLQVAIGCQKQIPWLPRSGDWSNGYPLQASESVFEQRRQQAGRRRISSSLSAPSGHHHIGTTAHPVLASLCRHGRQQGVDSSWLQGVPTQVVFFNLWQLTRVLWDELTPQLEQLPKAPQQAPQPPLCEVMICNDCIAWLKFREHVHAECRVLQICLHDLACLLSQVILTLLEPFIGLAEGSFVEGLAWS